MIGKSLQHRWRMGNLTYLMIVGENLAQEENPPSPNHESDELANFFQSRTKVSS